MLPVCLLHLVIRVVNGKIVEDEVIYDPQRFLVEDFFLLVIKPPGTYLNNELLLLANSSFPATSVLLCAPLDPMSRVLTNITLKVAKSPLHFLIHNVVF